MQVLQTTLLTGPYDWDKALLPKAEFDDRLARIRAAMAADALLVHGHAFDYGALAYLTGFVPKLGLALALVPNTGEPRLIVSGTALMLTQAKLLTWVDDVRSAANVPKLVAEWVGETGARRLALWGAGAMADGLHRGIANAVRPLAEIVAADDALDAVRRRKSPRETSLTREAARILGRAATRFAASLAGGAGARSAALAAEGEAFALGAQDVRIMASAHPGGPPLPIDGPEDRMLDPLLAGIAVQYAGYWAEAALTVASRADGAPAHAAAALGAVVRAAKPGAAVGALERIAAPHALRVTAIGLSLEEGRLSGAAVLEAGATYVLRVSAEGALAGAMIAVAKDGTETLWSAR
jgi:Xaa-Pro aminopeptidase